MTIFRKIVGGIAGVVLLAVIAAVPAQAATSPSSCAAGYACLWKDEGFTSYSSPTASVRFQYKIPKLSQYYYWTGGVSAKDTGSSLYSNGTSYATRWYEGEQFTGLRLDVPKGISKSTLLFLGWNDRIESACFVSNCVA